MTGAWAPPSPSLGTILAALDGLRDKAEAACRDGFAVKASIRPGHADVVGAAFMPDQAPVHSARKVLPLTAVPAAERIPSHAASG